MSGRASLVLALVGCGRVGFDAQCGIDALTISPTAAHANFDSLVQFDATGGCPPYRFTQTGPGEIDVDGRYVTTSQVGTSEVTVTDTLGDTARATLEIGGTSLWFLGGAVNEVPKDEIWRSDDGLAWTMVGTLPVPVRSAATLVFDDRIWVIGGTDAQASDAVWVSADGVTWSQAGRLPAPDSYPSAAVFERQIWVIGGNGVPGQVLKSNDGAAWAHAGDLPILSHGASAIVHRGRLWYLGGHDVDNVLYDEARSTIDGASWTVEGRLPSERELTGSWIANDQLVVAGGLGAAELDEVVTSSDGVSWTVEGTLPATRYYGGFAELGARRWAVGGTDGGAVWSSADGLSWTVEDANFPLPRSDGGLVAFTPR